jgi:hypothetical protein
VGGIGNGADTERRTFESGSTHVRRLLDALDRQAHGDDSPAAWRAAERHVLRLFWDAMEEAHRVRPSSWVTTQYGGHSPFTGRRSSVALDVGPVMAFSVWSDLHAYMVVAADKRLAAEIAERDVPAYSERFGVRRTNSKIHHPHVACVLSLRDVHELGEPLRVGVLSNVRQVAEHMSDGAGCTWWMDHNPTVPTMLRERLGRARLPDVPMPEAPPGR